MSEIKYRQTHSKSLEEVRALLDELSTELQNRFDLKPVWHGDRQVSFKRKGISGELRFDESEVAVSIQLGLMMRAFKSTIEKEIRSAMQAKLT